MNLERNSKLLQFMYTQIDIKCLKVIKSLDIQISRTLKDCGIETRPVKSNGLWCFILLPTVLLVYTWLYKVSRLYSLMAYISTGLLFYSILFIVFISISCLVLKEPIYGGCIASGLISALLVYIILGQDLVFSLLFTVPTVFMYSSLLRLSLTVFSKTFTIGEAMVVVQGVVLFAVMALAKLMCNLDDTDDEMDFVNTIVYTVLTTVGLVITALYLLTDEQRHLHSLGYIVVAAGIFMLSVLHSLLGADCILKILYYVLMDQKRVQIFIFWLFLVLVAVFVLTVRTKMAVKASTVTRKSFHVLASLVFLSGILADVALMKLAAGIGFGLLILVEALRKSGIEPISSSLQSAFLVYSDEKDCGSFAVTPMYLYLGLACPLALVPMHAGAPLELLAGVLATGVGDTAASWFGSTYGNYRWAGGNRTMEGTAFYILSQIVTIYALEIFELLDAKNALIRAGFAATVSGLVEAKTDQVDNLILPLTTLIAFQATWFLC